RAAAPAAALRHGLPRARRGALRAPACSLRGGRLHLAEVPGDLGAVGARVARDPHLPARSRGRTPRRVAPRELVRPRTLRRRARDARALVLPRAPLGHATLPFAAASVQSTDLEDAAQSTSGTAGRTQCASSQSTLLGA